MADINLWAVLLAAASAFLLGGIWYGPLFKHAWCREAGVDPDKPNGHPAAVFGVPTLAVEGELFWGNDSHDLMLAALEDPGLLRQGELAGVAAIPVGVERRR